MLKLAVSASEILAASPYLTDRRLFKEAQPACARLLYIDFSAIHFISGASHLHVLAKLVKDGVKVFHVPNLHAKVVMMDGRHFSIGSQNLTLKGRRTNVEASFVSGSDTPVEDVRRFFDRIQKLAIPVSPQDVLEMTQWVKPLLPKFKELLHRSEQVDEQVQQAREERRLAELRRLQEAEKRKRQALLKIRKFVNRSKPTPANHLIASVRELYHHHYVDIWSAGGSTDSLVPVHSNQDFEILLKAIGIWPQKLSRYLIINAESGQLGLVRFAKTRWTFFGGRLKSHEKLQSGFLSWEVDIDFTVDLTHTPPRNGVARLKCVEFPLQILSVGFFFSVEGLEVEDVTVQQRFFRRLEIEPSQMKKVLTQYLFKKLTTPFKFSANLYGQQARTFFGAIHPSRLLIQVHRLGSTAIFSARKTLLY